MSDQWEYVLPIDDGKDAQPAVRRLAVSGGWLYQTEHLAYEHTKTGRIVLRQWHPPVFVSDLTCPACQRWPICSRCKP